MLNSGINFNQFALLPTARQTISNESMCIVCKIMSSAHLLIEQKCNRKYLSNTHACSHTHTHTHTNSSESKCSNRIYTHFSHTSFVWLKLKWNWFVILHLFLSIINHRMHACHAISLYWFHWCSRRSELWIAFQSVRCLVLWVNGGQNEN